MDVDKSKVFVFGKYQAKLSRYTRGCVFIIHKNNKNVCEWADQSIQYKCLGWHDLIENDECNWEDIRKDLDTYKENNTREDK